MAPAPAQRWFCLPEATQAAVLTLLAAMIARGVLVGEEVVGDDGD